MKRTTRFLAAGLAALTLPFSAGAQVAGDEEFLTMIELITADCLDALDFEESSDEIAGICQSALYDIYDFTSEEDMDAQDVHSRNHVHYAAGFLHHTIGSEYTAIDGALTQQACNEVEKAWKEVSQIDMTAPLPDMAGPFRDSRASTADSVAFCREHHAAPDWAAPLD